MSTTRRRTECDRTDSVTCEHGIAAVQRASETWSTSGLSNRVRCARTDSRFADSRRPEFDSLRGVGLSTTRIRRNAHSGASWASWWARGLGDYPERCRTLTDAGIAVWDVLRQRSVPWKRRFGRGHRMDTARPNDFAEFFARHPGVLGSVPAFNGRKAYAQQNAFWKIAIGA